ncbi:Bug family tripartite tricarboxylate transporter substrate binding protein [Paeniroseomonas aquatica]|uniref:Bug family tripartite tricarboxylate transporter substrate binding protein n=1 Tax=Paeniroseomonas aquatica TaxID=373043 RepID=UPI0036103EC7
MLKADAGVDILHVPFRGGADTANQIMGGRIDLGVNNLPSAIALIRGGQLRALAVTSPERSEALPEVPTIADRGCRAWPAMPPPPGSACRCRGARPSPSSTG